MMDELQEDMTTEILQKLPTKDVARARAVCNTWRNIINNPKFLALLLAKEVQADTQSTFLFLPNSEDHLAYLVDQVQELLFHAKKINFRSPQKSRLLSRSCVNGLIAQSSLDWSKTRLCTQIYNPITRDVAQLPDIFAPPTYNIDTCTSSFVFDNLTKQYKVVQLYCLNTDAFMSYYYEARIHILGSNSWRKLEYLRGFRYLNAKSVAEVGGSLHWLTMHYILTFDLASEKFGSMEHPEYSTLAARGWPHNADHHVDVFHIMNLGGCLSIVDTRFDPNTDSYFEVWVMKKYNMRESWQKLKIMHATQCLGAGIQFKKILPLSFNKDTGEMFLRYDSKIVSYNTKCRKYSPYLAVCNKDKDWSKYSFDVYPFIVNLVPLQILLEN